MLVCVRQVSLARRLGSRSTPPCVCAWCHEADPLVIADAPEHIRSDREVARKAHTARHLHIPHTTHTHACSSGRALVFGKNDWSKKTGVSARPAHEAERIETIGCPDVEHSQVLLVNGNM